MYTASVVAYSSRSGVVGGGRGALLYVIHYMAYIILLIVFSFLTNLFHTLYHYYCIILL